MPDDANLASGVPRDSQSLPENQETGAGENGFTDRPTLIRPVMDSERLPSLDIFRGFALLGILTMNISSFALPAATRLNPMIAGGFSDIHYVIWWIGYLFFDEKMITLFAMLFGAGVYLFSERAIREGQSVSSHFYRRSGILLLVGIFHAYLFWEGDILFSYALCGLIVFRFCDRSCRSLLISGLLLILIPFPILRGLGYLCDLSRSAAQRIEWSQLNGEASSKDDQLLAPIWESIRKSFHPNTHEVHEAIQLYQKGGYWDLVANRTPESLGVQFMLFPCVFIWTITGRMFLGIALLKLGILSAQCSRRTYLQLMFFGYAIGLPLVWIGGWGLVEHQFDVVYYFRGGAEWNSIGSLAVVLGHISLLILIYQLHFLRWLPQALAAVGRMALTNYLMQTLICTTLFNGYGFGLFGTLNRLELLGIVLAIWGVQIFSSWIWLRKYRFGPMEWLWRSLTYGKRQSMRLKQDFAH